LGQCQLLGLHLGVVGTPACKAHSGTLLLLLLLLLLCCCCAGAEGCRHQNSYSSHSLQQVGSMAGKQADIECVTNLLLNCRCYLRKQSHATPSTGLVQ
jgi:hypothetical protein